MKRLAWIVTFLLLAAFTAATAEHAVATTTMSLDMAAAGDMDDCDGCPASDGASAACDQICIQPFTALPASEPAEMTLAAAQIRQSAAHGLAGRTGPPERHPPR